MKVVVLFGVPQVVKQMRTGNPPAGHDLAIGQSPIPFRRIAIGPQPPQVGKQQTVAILH
jgi:hypothetical protein